MTAQSQKILDKAAEKCLANGSKFTLKRSQVLEILLHSKTPLSAYEIVEAYQERFEDSIPAMSVYRILDFLTETQLVHKLSSEKKYLPCKHIMCSHDHAVPQFLICTQCKKVKEITIKQSIIDDLNEYITQSSYQLLTPQIELNCICKDCLLTQQTTN